MFFPGEVHISVSQLNYELHGKNHPGICSTYLGGLADSQPISFIKPNGRNGTGNPCFTELTLLFQETYVQHRLLEKSREVYHWLENGARIYVCGDMTRMAADVNKALVDVVSKEGGISVDKALEYVKGLRKEKRYLEDVY